MELSMSMFASPADYWKARSKVAEDEVERLSAELTAYKLALYRVVGDELTATRTQDGELIAITRTDREHRVLEALWIAQPAGGVSER